MVVRLWQIDHQPSTASEVSVERPPRVDHVLQYLLRAGRDVWQHAWLAAERAQLGLVVV